MRVVAWTGMLLVLTMLCSVAGLARLMGMPISVELLAPILMLAGLVGGYGAALMAVPEWRLVPDRVAGAAGSGSARGAASSQASTA